MSLVIGKWFVGVERFATWLCGWSFDGPYRFILARELGEQRHERHFRSVKRYVIGLIIQNLSILLCHLTSLPPTSNQWVQIWENPL